MISIIQLIACILLVFCILLVILRIIIGTVKFLYKYAPLIIFLVAAIAYLIITDQIYFSQMEDKNANNIGSVEIKSGRNAHGNEWNNNEILYSITPRS